MMLDRLNRNDYRLPVSRENKRSAAAERGRLDVAAPSPVAPVRRISSVELLGPGGELIIQHDGREYRLRLTQNGKLILTA
jgi:hemin uptake protein HemP